MKIQVPATSANIGSGFDSFGIAWQLYNTFYIEPSTHYTFENIEDQYANLNNLFITSYLHTCSCYQIEPKPFHLKFETNIPISRGLGSSSTLIVGGILCASQLHHLDLTKQQILEIATKIEGHPDNVAPAIFGGFTISTMVNGKPFTTKIQPHPSFHYYLWIPKTIVETSKARSILPTSYPRPIVIDALAKSALEIISFQNGDLKTLQHCLNDQIHQPYRKTLIEGYDKLKTELETQYDGVFCISGSGSTCLFITKTTINHPSLQEVLIHE